MKTQTHTQQTGKLHDVTTRRNSSPLSRVLQGERLPFLRVVSPESPTRNMPISQEEIDLCLKRRAKL